MTNLDLQQIRKIIRKVDEVGATGDSEVRVQLDGFPDWLPITNIAIKVGRE
jgi:hypothetical protein